MLRSATALLLLAVAGCSFTVGAASGGGGGADDAPAPDASTACAPAHWRDPAWTARYPLAIQHARVTGAPGDMAVLVAITSAELEHAQPGGEDLVFTASDGTSPLPFEIERFDPGSGALLAWVRFVTLSSTADTPFYLYFDNPAPPPLAAQDVWGDYLAVWHLREDPGVAGAPIRDSTAHGTDLVTQGMTTADRVPGKIGAGFALDGMNNGISRASFTLPAKFTYEAWVKPAHLDSFRAVFDTGQNNRWFGFYNADLDFYDGAIDHVFDTGATSNAWHHIAATSNGTQIVAYYDGAPAGLPLMLPLSAQTAALDGGFSNIGEWFAGTVDELRISSVPLSRDVIATSYASASAPDEFVAVGDLERCH